MSMSNNDISNQTTEVKAKSFSLRLFRYCDRKDYTLITSSIVFNIGAGTILPIFMSVFGDLVNTIAVPGGRDMMWYIRLQLYLGVVAFVTCTLGSWFIELAAERQIRKLKCGFLRSLTRQEMGWFDKFDSGELATKLNESLKVIREAIGLKFAQGFLFLGMFVGGYVVGFIRGWKLTLVISASLPLLAVGGFLIMMILSAADSGQRAAYAGAGSIAEESFSTVRSIAAFGLEPRMIKEFEKRLMSSYSVGVKQDYFIGAGMGFTIGVMFLTYALGFWYGGKLVADDVEYYGFKKCFDADSPCFTGGEALAVFFSILIAAFAIGQASPSITAMSKASSAVIELEEMVNRVSAIDPEDESGYRPDKLEGKIEFQNVKFAYPSRQNQPIFKNMNLTIPAGKTVALVGSSGCGKSTIIQLVERFYDPEDGKILIDDRDIRDYNLKSLRKKMALVSQEPRLLSDSINRNILAGKLEANDDEVLLAAKNSNAHNFVSEFPKGYDTYVGESGGQLSGGQKQRIAIARAVIRDPSILILDEATSALDNESERIVQQTLDSIIAQKKRTTIIIAHRLTTIRNADIIFVLDNVGNTGSVVVEQGTHDELLKNSEGLYSMLIAAQNLAPEVEVLEIVDPLLETFVSDVPQRQQSILKLRSKFRNTVSKSGSILSKAESMDVTAEKVTSEQVTAERVRWHTLFGLLRDYKRFVAIGMFGSVASGLVWPLYAICFSRFLSAFFLPTAPEIRSESAKWALVFVGFAVGVFFGTFSQHYGFGRAGNAVVKELRMTTFESIIYQDMEFFDNPKHTTGTLSEVLSSDTRAVRGWIADNTGIYLNTTVSIIAALIISMLASPKLAGVCLGACLILVPAIILETKFLQGAGNDGNSNITSGFIMNETITNIRVVAAFSLEHEMCARFESVVDTQYAKGRKNACYAGFAWGFAQGVPYGVQALCLWYGSTLVKAGDITMDEMFRAIFALIMAAMGAGQAMTFAVEGVAAQNAANRVYAMINRQPKISARFEDGELIERVENQVHFKNVNFAYPQRRDVQVYRNLDFTIQKGEIVALVGPSGCGKSTAVQLLERFYDVDEAVLVAFPKEGQQYRSGGAIEIDGVDLRDLNVRSLRAHIGLVNQEPVLFDSTIAENIALGKEGATREEIEGAAKMANAYDFIMDFPEK